MAAQSVVRRGYEDPVETYSSNVMGTVHLLRGAAPARAAVRRGQRDERQVLREPRVGLGLSRERTDGRQGSRTRTRRDAPSWLTAVLSRLVLSASAYVRAAWRGARQRARRKRDRRRRLDERTSSFPI